MSERDTTAPEPPGQAAEPRWPIAAAVLTATILYVGTPHRGRVPGWWLFPVVQLVLLGILIAQDPGRIDRRSPRLRRLMVTLLVVMTAGTVLGVAVLAHDILVAAEGVTATVLLGRGAAIWVANVIIFSLWYWEFDRGGPGARAMMTKQYPDFVFPQMTNPELAPVDWESGFVDYLYVSFTNAMAFSPTDVMPLTRWAKLTMLTQSVISVVTLVLVIARAVNIL